MLDTLNDVHDTLIGGTNDELIRSIGKAKWSISNALYYIHKEVESRIIRESYEDSVCPDCGDAIPTDVEHEAACTNCGHVFYDPRLNRGDDESDTEQDV
jgi:predicted RNA-binding Zn-ribbon protein involved in translation (DUF1610 family)